MGILDPLLPVELLYDYRGVVGNDEEAPPSWLPHHQGDVFAGLTLPGLPADKAGLAMLFQHPCTMRAGAVLKAKATVVKVEKRSKEVQDDPAEWEKKFAVMPLPDLLGLGEDTHVANFMSIATVDSGLLDREARIAVLSVAGRLQFQQRIIHHLSRFAPTTHELSEATAAVESEISLQADWVERAVTSSGTISSEIVTRAEVEFDEYMAGNGRREALAVLSESHRVIGETVREMNTRYPN